MSMKCKRDMHMKFDVPCLLLSESLIYFLLFFISFFEDGNKRCPICRKYSFGKTFSQRLTTCPNIWI